MKLTNESRKAKIYVTQALVFIFLIYGAVAPLSAFEDAIVAVVNDEVITARDVQSYLRSTYVNMLTQGVGEEQVAAVMEELQKNGLQKLIEDKLILSRANKAGLEIREELIDQRIKDLQKNYGSEKELVAALVAHGASITDLRNKILEQLKIKYIVDHEVKNKIFVNPHEITDFYEKNLSLFKTKERVFVESIFIAKNSDAAQARSRIDEAIALIQSGQDFIEIAKKYSQLPSVGAVEEGQLKPDFEKAIFALPLLGVSQIVEADDGFYVFKVTGRKSPVTAELKDVKDKIHERIYQMKFKKRFMTWLEGLEKEAYIDIKK